MEACIVRVGNLIAMVQITKNGSGGKWNERHAMF